MHVDTYVQDVCLEIHTYKICTDEETAPEVVVLPRAKFANTGRFVKIWLAKID